MSKLTLFTKEDCAPCKSMKQLLNYKEIEYQEVPAFKDGLVTKEFEPYASAGARTVPVLAKNIDNFSTGSTYDAVKFLLT